MAGQHTAAQQFSFVNTGNNGLFITREDSEPMTLADAVVYAKNHNMHVPTVTEALQVVEAYRRINGECELTNVFKGAHSVLCTDQHTQEPIAVFLDRDEPVVQTADTVAPYRFAQTLEERPDSVGHLKLLL